MHANTGTGSVVQRGRMTPEEVDVKGRAQRAVQTATRRPEVRRAIDASGTGVRAHSLLRTDGSTRGLERVGYEIVTLFNAGAMEAEVRAAYVGMPTELIDTLWVGTARRGVPELDLANALAEAREREAFVKRVHDANNPMILDLEAEACEHSAAVDTERARVLRAKARRMRGGRDAGRAQAERFGIARTATAGR